MPLRKSFVANEHHSFTFVFTFSVIVVNLQTDCILSFLFPTDTDVLVPVLSQSTDVFVMNFVVVLKFPNIWTKTDLSSPVKRCNFILDFFNPEIYFNLMQLILFEYCYSNIKEMPGYFVRTGNYQKLNISIRLMYWTSNWKTAYQTASRNIEFLNPREISGNMD